MLTKAKPSSLKSLSKNLKERKKEPIDSSKRKPSTAAHTHEPKGNTKPQGSTSTLPRPANTWTDIRETGQVKSAASNRGAFNAKGPNPRSTSCGNTEM